MPPLNGGVDVFEAIWTISSDRQYRPGALRKATVRLVGPLHRRARTIAFRKRKIVSHADFIAVANDGRARQREQETVRQFELTLVAIEHRRKAASDTAFVKLHLRL